MSDPDLARVRERMVDLEDFHTEEINVEQVIARLLDFEGDPDLLGRSLQAEAQRTIVLFERVYHGRLGLPVTPLAVATVGMLQGITFAVAYMDTFAVMAEARTRPVSEHEQRLIEASLLAELWLRSSDETTRRVGADLKQILDGDAG